MLGGAVERAGEELCVRLAFTYLTLPPLSLHFVSRSLSHTHVQLPSTASLQAGVRVQSATQKLRSNMDSTLPQIKSVLKKAMHSQHGLDVAGFIKRHDHEMKGCVRPKSELLLPPFASSLPPLTSPPTSPLRPGTSRWMSLQHR